MKSSSASDMTEHLQCPPARVSHQTQLSNNLLQSLQSLLSPTSVQFTPITQYLNRQCPNHNGKGTIAGSPARNRSRSKSKRNGICFHCNSQFALAMAAFARSSNQSARCGCAPNLNPLEAAHVTCHGAIWLLLKGHVLILLYNWRGYIKTKHVCEHKYTDDVMNHNLWYRNQIIGQLKVTNEAS